MIRYLTAGESHGIACSTIIEGVPSGICVQKKDIEMDLIRRQAGYCRGWRQAVEKNELHVTAGVHNAMTTGAPINIMIYNTEGVHNPVWRNAIGAYPEEIENSDVTYDEAVNEKFRSVFIPGHADLPGIIKYRHECNNLRFVSDRASARETITRVTVGTIAKQFLAEFGISVLSYVTQMGNAKMEGNRDVKISDGIIEKVKFIDNQIINNFRATCKLIEERSLTIFDVPTKTQSENRKQIINILNENLAKLSDCEKVKCPNEAAAKAMVAEIDEARKEGDTVGGVIKIVAANLPPGLGSYVHCDKRLGSKIASSILGIPAVKGVEFGKGFDVANMRGSELHDPITMNGEDFFQRKTNNAGGLEGGMTNSEPLIVNVAIKPISMISKKAIQTVDIKTGEETAKTSGERADVSAIPSATVIGESIVAIEIANAIIEKFGGDQIDEIKENFKNYISYVTEFYKNIKSKKA